MKNKEFECEVKATVSAEFMRKLFGKLDREQKPYEARISGHGARGRIIAISTYQEHVKHFADMLTDNQEAKV